MSGAMGIFPPVALLPKGSCEKIDVEPNQVSPSPWPSPPKRGRGEEKIRVNSLAPIGGEGARRAGEGGEPKQIQELNWWTCPS